MVAVVLTLAFLTTLSGAFNARQSVQHSPASDNIHRDLAAFALQKVLNDAAPVFGIVETAHNDAEERHDESKLDTSRWMSRYPESTPITHMNIPGTHDAATWNYSLATQKSLDHITSLVNATEIDPRDFRCQTRSMFDALQAGIRVFDLRYAYDVTKSGLVFWHGPGLQSETARVGEVLFGFYQWLDSHPTEALFLSFQFEGTTFPNSSDDEGVQRMLFDALTTPAAKAYILQTRGSVGTLGEARGKITLLKRFDLDLLPASYDEALPGLHFSPQNWTDNGPDVTLVYNTTTGGTAYIEDYYQPLTPQGSPAEENIRWKFNATKSHLEKASTQHPGSLFWSFASSTNIGNSPPDTPETQALGNGTMLTPKGGVNQQLLELFKSFEGKRLGIVMFDFFETPSELVPTFLRLLPPDKAKNYKKL